MRSQDSVFDSMDRTTGPYGDMTSGVAHPTGNDSSADPSYWLSVLDGITTEYDSRVTQGPESEELQRIGTRSQELRSQLQRYRDDPDQWLQERSTFEADFVELERDWDRYRLQKD
jgi:hypothetical protein